MQTVVISSEQFELLVSYADKLIFLLQSLCIAVSFCSAVLICNFIIYAKNQKSLF